MEIHPIKLRKLQDVQALTRDLIRILLVKADIGLDN